MSIKAGLRAVCLFAWAGTAFSTAAVAGCTDWWVQADGTYWRMCTDQSGHNTCYKADDRNGTNQKEVKCS